MEIFEKDGRQFFASNSGTVYRLPGSAAFEGIPHFELVRRHGTNDCRCLYQADAPNFKGERLLVELNFCDYYEPKKGSLPVIWHEKGWMDHVLDTSWHISVSAYDENDVAHGKYNPTIKCGEYRDVIDFNWMFEATEENALKLFAEVYERFMAA